MEDALAMLTAMSLDLAWLHALVKMASAAMAFLAKLGMLAQRTKRFAIKMQFALQLGLSWWTATAKRDLWAMAHCAAKRHLATPSTTVGAPTTPFAPPRAPPRLVASAKLGTGVSLAQKWLKA
jgi:hypothetical protein